MVNWFDIDITTYVLNRELRNGRLLWGLVFCLRFLWLIKGIEDAEERLQRTGVAANMCLTIKHSTYQELATTISTIDLWKQIWTSWLLMRSISLFQILCNRALVLNINSLDDIFDLYIKTLSQALGSRKWNPSLVKSILFTYYIYKKGNVLNSKVGKQMKWDVIQSKRVNLSICIFN